MPYQTASGNTYVLAYGAIPSDTTAIKLPYLNTVAGYIVPVNDQQSYQQTVPGSDTQWSEGTNHNDSEKSFGASNGYYRIVFNDAISNYIRNHPGYTGGWEFNATLKWQNINFQTQKRAQKATDLITIYTEDGSDGSYSPRNDLQIGNQTSASGLSVPVKKIDRTQDPVQMTKDTKAVDHTGSVPAHRWFQTADGKYYLAIPGKMGQGDNIDHDIAQSVGISLSTEDSNHNQLGNDFTITVTKPASNDDVTTGFVAHKDLQDQLQKIVVPVVSGDASHLLDKVNGSGYYLTNQVLYQRPQVTVDPEEYSNHGNTVTYHVHISGDYAGFEVSAGSDSPFTLITWKPTDPMALLPGEEIDSPAKDYSKVTYHSNTPGVWLNGYPIRNDRVREYMASHPWHVKVANNSGFNFDEDYGYWIDRGANVPPQNEGYVQNHFYGFVNQVIHYVDENGHVMKDAAGNDLADTNRNVRFDSDDQGNFTGTKSFDDITLPVVDGFSAYAGVKGTDNTIKINNGKAVTTGGAITKYGAEDAFGFPTNEFVEYVVYKRNPKPDPKPTEKGTVQVHYLDVTGVNKDSYNPNDGHEVHTDPLTTYDLNDNYSNNLWDYQAANYELAMPIADNVKSGKVTQPKLDLYVYLKHRQEYGTETKSVHETIYYRYANGPHAGTQAAPTYNSSRTFTRSYVKDLVSGDISYGNWDTQLSFTAVNSPAIVGYTPDVSQIDEIKVSPDSNDIVKYVYYRTTPTPTPTPDPKPQPKPDPTPTPTPDPTPQPQPNPQPVPDPQPQPIPGSDTPSKPSQPATNAQPVWPAPATKQSTDQPRLPQTGATNQRGIVALGLVSLLAALGLGIARRKNN